ncbi:Rho GTPase activation protein [Lactarius hatsudake]|nr:Rho GTPase activation protein [Lactarius hatsudake]
MSFLSVDPRSKVLLENHSNSLLVRFDTQLEIIADRYLTFFKERRRIEATYIDSLRKLHRRAKTVDASFGPRAEPTTTRVAWGKVRDDLEREANTQQAFVDSLDHDVIKPLTTLKESKDERRKRIEENLKRSAALYADHAENKISKLQQVYLKKYHPHQYTRSTHMLQRPEDAPNKSLGGKISALFRGRWEDSRDPEPPKLSTSEEVSDDDCRGALSYLNTLRLIWAENLGDGYDCLEELVFTSTVKDVLVKYMDGMITTCTKHDELAMSTRAEVEKAFAGTDTSDLRGSFRRALSFSIPPRTLYHSYRPGEYSDLIFGVPLVDVETNEDNVPKVMRMCIEEVEKRGLNTKGIYSLRRRFESERPFSFSSTDNIYSVAGLLKCYLWDLPEPLFMLSLQDYRNYKQNRARFTENNFSLLRSKIRKLHPIHRASLHALLRHLLRVSSHSDTNATTVDALAGYLCYAVLRGNTVLVDGVHGLVLEDLIQNVHTLFDERPPPPPHFPSPHMAETTSTYTYGSFLSPELPPLAEVQAMGSTTRHRPTPGLVGSTPMESGLAHRYRFPY